MKLSKICGHKRVIARQFKIWTRAESPSLMTPRSRRNNRISSACDIVSIFIESSFLSLPQNLSDPNSPFDSGLYHLGTIRTNRTNRQLGQTSLRIQRLGHILSPPNEMHFSIRQRVVSHGHESFESNESTTRRRVS